jgi:hypothetical protein
MKPDRNCLSYWFPKLEAAGLPVPKTVIVPWPGEPGGLADILDGKTPEGFEAFIDTLHAASCLVATNGQPYFLRTGLTSGKHSWKRTCSMVRDPLDMPQLKRHVCALVEFSHMADIMGLAHDIWVVREMLPVSPIAVLPLYGNMPLVKEIRGFVRDGMIECWHPYWPPDSIQQGFGCDEDEIAELSDVIHEATTFDAAELDAALALLRRAAVVFADDGEWSIDVFKTRNGWYVTDMAEAARSWHWPDCWSGIR